MFGAVQIIFHMRLPLHISVSEIVRNRHLSDFDKLLGPNWNEKGLQQEAERLGIPFCKSDIEVKDFLGPGLCRFIHFPDFISLFR